MQGGGETGGDRSQGYTDDEWLSQTWILLYTFLSSQLQAWDG